MNDKIEMLGSYSDYCTLVHSGQWKKTAVCNYLCEAVESFVFESTGNPYDILIISMPPQHGKSMTVTETFPGYYLCKNPEGRIIEISYNEELAILFGRRNLYKILEYGEDFGLVLAKSPRRSREFEVNNNVGGMISRGVMSGITGRACNLMIIDDPIKNRREADSAVYRQRLFEEWENSFKTRLSVGAKVILIQTRWHEDDLAGKLIAGEKNVQVINLPCEAQENDILGRAVGDALAPEIGKDNTWLKAFKESYIYNNGTRAWNALFQGSPSATGGNVFMRDWWKYYDSLPDIEYLLLSVDAAFKSNDDSDYVAVQLWGRSGADFYLVKAIKSHLDFPQTLSAIKSILQAYTVNLILIEDKANGSAIISMLKREFSNVLGVNPLGGKEARANAITGVIESGRVHLPKFESFTEDFIEECSAFPYGRNDDQVDAMTQALNRMVYYNGKSKKNKSLGNELHRTFTFNKKRKNLTEEGEEDYVL